MSKAVYYDRRHRKRKLLMSQQPGSKEKRKKGARVPVAPQRDAPL
jgi:hypothetical protein